MHRVRLMSKTDGLSGAGVAIGQPYEAGHMSSFSASPNRSGAPEPATTGLSSGGAPTMPHPPDTATAFSSPGMTTLVMSICDCGRLLLQIRLKSKDKRHFCIVTCSDPSGCFAVITNNNNMLDLDCSLASLLLLVQAYTDWRCCLNSCP